MRHIFLIVDFTSFLRYTIPIKLRKPFMEPLTDKQMDTLKFIVQYYQARRRPPKLVEIAQGLSLANTSTAQWRVDRLAEKKYLGRRKGRIFLYRALDYYDILGI